VLYSRTGGCVVGHPGPGFVFDSFEVDLEAHELRKEGTRVRLQPQPFEILVALLDRAGAVVTLEDLRSRLWGSGIHLDAAQSIHRSVNRLRAALCDSAVNPRYIETVNRTGYRFIARVERSGFEQIPSQAPQEREPKSSELSRSTPGVRLSSLRPLLRWRSVPLAAVLLLLALWAGFRSHVPSGVRLRELTFNAPEMPVGTGALSPDGKLFAFSDASGLHVQQLERGEVHSLSIPIVSRINDIAWAPDSAVLYIAAENGLWRASVFGAPVNRIGEPAAAIAVSPDGRKLAVKRDRDIWVATSDGDDARQIFAAHPAITDISGPSWSPDSEHIAYVKYVQGNEQIEPGIEVRDATGGPATVVVSGMRLHPCVLWLADGRILFARGEPPPTPRSSNLWYVRLDRAGTRAIGMAPLTELPDFSFTNLSASANGRQVAFLRYHYSATSYAADFDTSVPALTNLHFVAASSSHEQPRLVTRDRDVGDAVMSPDGRWILFETETGRTARLIRVSSIGGERQELFEVSREANSIRCPRHGSLCIVGELNGGHYRFSTFDPVAQTGKNLLPITGPEEHLQWDLSPDGSLLAIAVEGTDRVRIVDLAGQQRAQLSLHENLGLMTVTWVPDGSGIVITGSTVTGPAAFKVLCVREGVPKTLWSSDHQRLSSPFFSEDGKRITFASYQVESNAWLLTEL
jgi:DNA-binding winged helix-turn-helix (wHTH) protein/Tol biopolymer transport system component